MSDDDGSFGIQKPLLAIDELFQAFLAEGKNAKEWELPENVVEDIVSQREQIPSLNDIDRMHIQPGSLVRFRCMIQDTHNPELYTDVYEVSAQEDGVSETSIRTTRYRDEDYIETDAPIVYDSQNMVLKTRLPIHCTPIPAECLWTLKGFESQCDTVSVMANLRGMATSSATDDDDARLRDVRGKAAKRGMDDDEDDDEEDGGKFGQDQDLVAANQQGADGAKKDTGDADGGLQAQNLKGTSISESPQKMRQLQRPGTEIGDVSTHHEHNLPIATEQTPAIVKVYCDEPTWKIHDAVEVIGVYMNTPSLQEEPSEFNFGTILPSPAVLPRIHCVHMMPLMHLNPHLPSTLDKEQAEAALQDVVGIRDVLKGALLTLLNGDDLLAEYLILHLSSTVRLRTSDGGLTNGHMPLNIYGLVGDNADIAPRLIRFIEAIRPCAYAYDLSIENLNSSRMNPTKDHTTDRLDAGQLQLVDGTHLTLNEIAMQAGDLREQGIRNVAALHNLIKSQQVHFVFEHAGTMPFNLDVQVLVLSEGRSFLPMPVKLCVPSKIESDTSVALLDEELVAIRKYLELIRHVDYSIPSDLQDKISHDFSSWRQDNPELQGDALHRLLTIARALSLSHGQFELTEEMWSSAHELDEAIQERMKQ